MTSSLDQLRRFFADEVAAIANVHTRALVDAFAAVAREQYLGPGPWQIALPGLDMMPGAKARYRTTADADPRHLYHNVVVAIDPARQLNNGQPSALALWMDALSLRRGARALHVGCGVGYYTAILAHAVGPTGRVVAIEYDPDLAARARANLAGLAHVEVVHADGTTHDPGEFDAGLINAGVTRIATLWLDRLAPGGRLVVPLTFAAEPSGMGTGLMLAVERDQDGYPARFISGVSIYPCTSGRDADSNAAVREMLMSRSWGRLRQVRRDPHTATGECVMHLDGACLSATPLEPPPAAAPVPRM